MKIYSNQELVNQRDAAHLEIKRLQAKPDQSEELKKLAEEIRGLHEHVARLVEQRDELHKSVKHYLGEA